MESTTSEQGSHHVFQAEVRQLLDIVIHSLYTDSEIFIRELVSNASDALEKMRLRELTESGVEDAGSELAIEISADEAAKTLTIRDSGIGMTRDEMIENLGTIAHSGTKAFIQAMKERGESGAEVIGQFGVGFYSAFMAADRVEVTSKSWAPGSATWKWSSDGQSGYDIEEVEPGTRGSTIVLHLKEEEFSKIARVKEVLRKYSSFVSFPIQIDGERVNTVGALWLKNKSEVSEEEYKEFYQFHSHAWDEPRYTMHFSADVPLEIHALLYVPSENQELFGMGQMEAGVSLYCKKVLIDSAPQGLLPDWLRFLRGVIDSADLPLNISRETMQDSALVRKLNQLITKRFIKFLDKQAKDDADRYKEFYDGFSRFLKEGVASSYEHQDALAKLLRFESSSTEAGKVTSFGELVERAGEDSKEIYYLLAPSREIIEGGPYLEAFKARGIEVAFFTDPIDGYIFQNLHEFSGRKLVAADRAGIELGELPETGDSLAAEDLELLRGWLSEKLGDKVEGVEPGNRLVNSPVAALTPQNSMTPQMRQMMKAMGQDAAAPKPTLQINPRHPLIHKLAALRGENEELAEIVAEQLTDQALMAAGLMENPQSMTQRMNDLLEKLLPGR